MKYMIYFQFLGKRFKMEMQSDDYNAIRKYLASRICIDKIEPVNDPVNDTEAFYRIMDLLGFKDKLP